MFGGPSNVIAFEVTQGVPLLSTMSTPFVLASHTTTVTFTGTRLLPPLTFISDNDIQFENVTTDASSTSATVSMIVATNATLGVHSVRVFSGGLQSGTLKFMVRSLTRQTDFNGDGNADLLWYNASTGETAMSLMAGTNTIGSAVLLRDANWKVVATGDFDGDGKADLIWYNAFSGQTSIWIMNGTTVANWALLFTDPNWRVTAVNDFSGDGKADLLWYNPAGGETSLWAMNGTKQTAFTSLLTDPGWKVVSTGDFDEGIFKSSIRVRRRVCRFIVEQLGIQRNGGLGYGGNRAVEIQFTQLGPELVRDCTTRP